MNNNEILEMNLDESLFEFADHSDFTKDKKLETKPVGYFQDALYRFARNKASVTAFIIICLLVLFAIFAPIFGASNYSNTKNDNIYLRYSKLLPKLDFLEGTGFWDGTKRETINQNLYIKYYAMGFETGRDAITKLHSKEMRPGSSAAYYDVQIDSYIVNGGSNGMLYLTLTADEYKDLQKWQDENQMQVIFPAVSFDKDTISSFKSDAYIWYKIDKTGKPVAKFDKDGNPVLENIYKVTGNDDYTSTMRIDGDPYFSGNTEGRYRYAVETGTAENPGYKVRIFTYNYFIYRFGHEPSFIFGTDNFGYDIFTRLGEGARFSFLLAIFVSVINLTIGAIYGAIEGYYGGAADMIMERVRDILGGVPFMVVTSLFQLHLAAKVGPVVSLLFAFVLTGWLGMAGLCRMQFYRYKHQEYVLAARTLGAKDSRIMFKHIFPNALGTIVTSCVLVIPSVIFSESSLTYLGIVNLESSTITSVGTMLAHGKEFLHTYPHIILFPALFISLLMITFNLFGNGLRDAFNPSLRGADE